MKEIPIRSLICTRDLYLSFPEVAVYLYFRLEGLDFDLISFCSSTPEGFHGWENESGKIAHVNEHN